jgi:hypothetical protein
LLYLFCLSVGEKYVQNHILDHWIVAPDGSVFSVLGQNFQPSAKDSASIAQMYVHLSMYLSKIFNPVQKIRPP